MNFVEEFNNFAERLNLALAKEFKTEVLAYLEDKWKAEIAEKMNGCGSWSVICDTHIDSVRWTAIPAKYCEEMQKWLRGLGFKPFIEYNSHNVRYIKISH